MTISCSIYYIVEEILTRASDVRTCKSVCKLWHSIVKSEGFVKAWNGMHAGQVWFLMDDHTPLGKPYFGAYTGEECIGNAFIWCNGCRWTFDFPKPRVIIKDSSMGFLLVCTDATYPIQDKAFVVNPVSGMQHAIPPLPLCRFEGGITQVRCKLHVRSADFSYVIVAIGSSCERVVFYDSRLLDWVNVWDPESEDQLIDINGESVFLESLQTIYAYDMLKVIAYDIDGLRWKYVGLKKFPRYCFGSRIFKYRGAHILAMDTYQVQMKMSTFQLWSFNSQQNEWKQIECLRDKDLVPEQNHIPDEFIKSSADIVVFNMKRCCSHKQTVVGVYHMEDGTYDTIVGSTCIAHFTPTMTHLTKAGVAAPRSPCRKLSEDEFKDRHPFVSGSNALDREAEDVNECQECAK